MFSNQNAEYTIRLAQILITVTKANSEYIHLRNHIKVIEQAMYNWIVLTELNEQFLGDKWCIKGNVGHFVLY